MGALGPRVGWMVVALASRFAIAEPTGSPLSAAVRVGAHTTWLVLPDEDGFRTGRRSGGSLELEVAYDVAPRIALAAFVRVDRHGDGSPMTYTDEFFGLRARIHLAPRVYVGAGLDVIDEQEDALEDRRASYGSEAELGVVLIRTGHLAVELMLDVGRFTEGTPMFHGGIAWTRLSLGVRFH